MSYGDQLREITRKYRESGEPWPATTKQMAAWAIRHGHWEPQPSDLVRQCADQLARAMREEYYTDPQGRHVRAKHVIRTPNGCFWGDIRIDSRAHMEMSLQQRRQQIVGDCRQLKTDVDSFNENRAPEVPIQLSLDFTNDVAEMEAMARFDQEEELAPA